MKTILKNLIKQIIYYKWLYRCRISLIIEGTKGLSRIIALLPKWQIIPILQYFGANIGINCDIDPGLIVHRMKLPLKNLILGNNVHIGYNTLIDLTEEVSFGDNTAVGSFSMFITHTGDWTFDRSDEHEEKGKIKVGEAVIIYSGCIVSQGVSIGSYSRIAANSTVLNQIPEYSFAAGSPAIIKKTREDNYK